MEFTPNEYLIVEIYFAKFLSKSGEKYRQYFQNCIYGPDPIFGETQITRRMQVEFI